MDIRNFNKKLNKIVALTDQNGDEAQLTPLERDLLLSYIRELYDIALDGVIVTKPSSSKPTAAEIKPVDISAPEPVVTSAPAEEFVKPDVKEESKSEVVVPVMETSPEVAPTTSPKVEPIPVVQEEKPIVTHPINPIQSHINDDLIAELFVEDKVSELSDKLAQAPIKDLTKSMGINERIFTQQELFNNNASQFNDALMKLNSFGNFNEAKSFIVSELVSTYGWTNENKIKKAATFIKLVRRKYI
jgi:hypothetical protein